MLRVSFHIIAANRGVWRSQPVSTEAATCDQAASTRVPCRTSRQEPLGGPGTGGSLECSLGHLQGACVGAAGAVVVSVWARGLVFPVWYVVLFSALSSEDTVRAPGRAIEKY